MKKILFVTTISNTINAFLIPHIELLVKQGHKVDIACNIIKEIDPKIIKLGCKIFNIEFQRSPLKKENYTAYRKIKRIVLSEGYDLVHVHTPIASFLTRLACRNITNIKLLYTAHGFHFFKGAPLKNWLLYYPLEWWVARYTDVLITINKEDYTRAKKSFKAGRVEYIPGVGLDTKKFRQVVVDKLAKRREIGVPEDAFVVLSVGELNKNKNHETVIKAVAKLNNPNVYYVICGQGPLENYLKNLTKELGLEKQVKLLGYRKDIAEICKMADVFALPSKREGLGLAALEAMASGLPIVTSNVHGIVDYSIDGVTGYTCSPMDVDGFAEQIGKLAMNSQDCLRMGAHNAESVKKYDLYKIIKYLEYIYKTL